MSVKPEYPASNPAVQSHLTILQSVVTRMATNSASCKAWCITLVSAIILLVADKGKPQFCCLALIPAVLFLFLDAYYLALERVFRRSYEGFVRKVHQGKVMEDDLFEVKPSGSFGKAFFASLMSPSVWPFYVTLIGVALLTLVITLPQQGTGGSHP